jgi:excinuclease UvrABC helicase subunit UvrB
MDLTTKEGKAARSTQGRANEPPAKQCHASHQYMPTAKSQRKMLSNLNKQQNAVPKKPPTSLEERPQCKLQHTPETPAQGAGDNANTTKQVNQLQKTTATKAT